MGSDLVRLNYASTATFQPNVSGGIEVSVARILAESRRNNSECRIGGVLHYGDGYFFQCLEGEREVVNERYHRISQDDRHKDVQLLSFDRVSNRMFPDWSMKYLPIEGQIRQLLAKRSMTFNPYRFDDTMIDELLRLCVLGSDPTEADTAEPGKNGKLPLWKRILGRT
ncbi:BLUF domain-containing protein [Ectothiorhodospiraceae bacterium WFHF3C12]|nr:BLUF domain-containing protein [Ectothiorhodospiraceae bacterium WFHF3C12]